MVPFSETLLSFFIGMNAVAQCASQISIQSRIEEIASEAQKSCSVFIEVCATVEQFEKHIWKKCSIAKTSQLSVHSCLARIYVSDGKVREAKIFLNAEDWKATAEYFYSLDQKIVGYRIQEIVFSGYNPDEERSIPDGPFTIETVALLGKNGRFLAKDETAYSKKTKKTYLPRYFPRFAQKYLRQSRPASEFVIAAQ